MKLIQVTISYNELQDYLDKYQEKIKFMFMINDFNRAIGTGPNGFLLIIDEA